jgi:hypothetical protein
MATLIAAGPLSAAPRKKAAASSDRESRKRDAVERLCGIAWHTNFQAACEAAQPQDSDEIGKPVMHLRVLGALDGLM